MSRLSETQIFVSFFYPHTALRLYGVIKMVLRFAIKRATGSFFISDTLEVNYLIFKLF